MNTNIYGDFQICISVPLSTGYKNIKIDNISREVREEKNLKEDVRV